MPTIIVLLIYVSIIWICFNKGHRELKSGLLI